MPARTDSLAIANRDRRRRIHTLKQHHGASDLNGTARSVMVLLGGGDGTESQRRTLSDAEIRDCDWVGGIAASGSLCDRPSRVHHAAVEKRDHQGSQQRYHGSQMATMLD